MKHVKKLYPTYYRSLFVFYNSKEKRSVILTFFVMFGNVHLLFWGLPQNPASTSLWGILIMLNIAILSKVVINNSRIYNKRVMKESYGVEIDEYSKAFNLKFRRILFFKNLADTYPKYEDLLADYDDDYSPGKPNVKATFVKFLLFLFGAVVSIGTLLFEGQPLKMKISYLAMIVVFFIMILIIYFQFYPIVKDILHDRYKKDRLILNNIEEIKKTISQFPAKYVATNPLKTLLLNSDLIDEPFRPFFSTSPINGGISTMKNFL
ncbi:hypothetical protein GFS24_15400 [Chitinophaga sp. SYP-B3965]|uniref:hypothetical protein n=1 Tax=Chitinophaga sp. SYP-B3965 TaxID=2663120 RepID=UPI0012995325|nr:hypothetical protein [Chitinophaga sp. SYP-B3965]MRG46508.1 hypothetical protein [Chitinophaga sp. SYP-B3965]